MEDFKILLNNAILLIFLVFLFGEINYLYKKKDNLFKIIIGIIFGFIGIFIMMNPLTKEAGIIFDTRSILISFSGAFFGFIPTAVASIMMILFRIFGVGLEGVYAGVASILVSGILGLLWREYRLNKYRNIINEFWLFGFVVHVFVILCFFLIENPIPYIKSVSLPILIIYPIVTVIIAVTLTNRNKRQEMNDAIIESQILLKSSIETLKDVLIFSVDKDYKYLFFNDAHSDEMNRLYGVSIKKGLNILNIFDNENGHTSIKAIIDRALNGESFSEVIPYQKNIEDFVEIHSGPIINEKGKIVGATVFISNITIRLQNEKRLEITEETNKLIISTMKQGLAVFEVIIDQNNKPIDFTHVLVNSSYENIIGIKKPQLIGKSLKEIFPKFNDDNFKKLINVAITGMATEFEDFIEANQKHLNVSVYKPQKNQVAVIISDNTERKLHEEQIRYLSYNDYLTGLYNRRYYEEELERLMLEENLPFTVVMADINGLKLVNDAFGHNTGDQLIMTIANILKLNFRLQDTISRIGGDEFVVLMPKTTKQEAKQFIDSFKEYAKDKKIFGVSISVAFGIATETKDINEITSLATEAEKEMYNNKIYELNSNRSKTIQTILNTLHLINPREESHSRRVSELCLELGKKYGLHEDQLQLLKTTAILHDIGKIAVEEKVLNKVNELSVSEWEQIKRHPEIGYRILTTSAEYSEIAEDILYHHERYDGNGYPKGLQGEEIPWRSRIIAVCDAYDAMTSMRPYRFSISHEDAILELVNGKGKQFDPEMVDVFIGIFNKNNK